MAYFMVQCPMIDSQVRIKNGNAQIVRFSRRPSGNTVKSGRWNYSEVFKSWLLEADISMCFSILILIGEKC